MGAEELNETPLALRCRDRAPATAAQVEKEQHLNCSLPRWNTQEAQQPAVLAPASAPAKPKLIWGEHTLRPTRLMSAHKFASFIRAERALQQNLEAGHAQPAAPGQMPLVTGCPASRQRHQSFGMEQAALNLLQQQKFFYNGNIQQPQFCLSPQAGQNDFVGMTQTPSQMNALQGNAATHGGFFRLHSGGSQVAEMPLAYLNQPLPEQGYGQQSHEHQLAGQSDALFNGFPGNEMMEYAHFSPADSDPFDNGQCQYDQMALIQDTDALEDFDLNIDDLED